MQRELLVYMDLSGRPELVGRLWARERTGREFLLIRVRPFVA